MLICHKAAQTRRKGSIDIIMGGLLSLIIGSSACAYHEPQQSRLLSDTQKLVKELTELAQEEKKTAQRRRHRRRNHPAMEGGEGWQEYAGRRQCYGGINGLDLFKQVQISNSTVFRKQNIKTAVSTPTTMIHLDRDVVGIPGNRVLEVQPHQGGKKSGVGTKDPSSEMTGKTIIDEKRKGASDPTGEGRGKDEEGVEARTATLLDQDKS